MIIDAIARSTPATSRDAEFTIERVLGQLSHNNAAVALSTVRLVVKYLECITDPESIELLQAKIGPPLVEENFYKMQTITSKSTKSSKNQPTF